MIGLDTCVLIDLFRKDKVLIQLFATIQESIYLNDIVYLELLMGLDPDNKKHNEEERFYESLFSAFPLVQLNACAIKKTRDIFWKLKKEGKELHASDCSIAGIYLANGINTIITKNRSHFERIKGLKVLGY